MNIWLILVCTYAAVGLLLGSITLWTYAGDERVRRMHVMVAIVPILAGAVLWPLYLLFLQYRETRKRKRNLNNEGN